MRNAIWLFSGLLILGVASAEKPHKGAAEPAKEPPKAMPAPPPGPPMPKPVLATAELKDAKGVVVGRAKLEEVAQGVIVNLMIRGLPPGKHALHIHDTGKCDASTGFKSAGGHFNPEHKHHGIMNPEGMHEGDLPNIEVPASGEDDYQFFVHGVSLKPEGRNTVFDKDGSAIVIHKAQDDLMTDPAGNAGDRIACGVIEPAKAEAPKPIQPAK
jgi:Cu-Zn family superoxide dismutase